MAASFQSRLVASFQRFVEPEERERQGEPGRELVVGRLHVGRWAIIDTTRPPRRSAGSAAWESGAETATPKTRPKIETASFMPKTAEPTVKGLPVAADKEHQLR